MRGNPTNRVGGMLTYLLRVALIPMTHLPETADMYTNLTQPDPNQYPTDPTKTRPTNFVMDTTQTDPTQVAYLGHHFVLFKWDD